MFYDPMISKLIVRGPDRASALRKMASALDSFQVHDSMLHVSFFLSLAPRPTCILKSELVSIFFFTPAIGCRLG